MAAAGNTAAPSMAMSRLVRMRRAAAQARALADNAKAEVRLAKSRLKVARKVAKAARKAARQARRKLADARKAAKAVKAAKSVKAGKAIKPGRTAGSTKAAPRAAGSRATRRPSTPRSRGSGRRAGRVHPAAAAARAVIRRFDAASAGTASVEPGQGTGTP